MPAKKLVAIRRKLLDWYDVNQRDLPWRRSRDPYAIWVAETMLQQTQVATVNRYYERFIEAFPTVVALARAPLGKVMALWSGLGYYRRAQNLKAAARLLVRRHAALLPADYDRLLALPGVGAYTAGALMSIAFHKPYPAIDGNARRVLGRLFALKSEKNLYAAAAKLVSRARPGLFNQGLMELGATLCTPSSPRCNECPVALDCAARRSDFAAMKFAPKARRTLKQVTWPLAIVRCRGKILLRRRSADGLLAGLWELPGGELGGRRSIPACLENHLRELNGNVKLRHRLGEIRHSITSRNIRAPVFLYEVGPQIVVSLPAPGWRWVSPAGLHRYPVSSMTLKAIKCLAAHEKNFL
jgi:A/G-specific adenine glycosylase